MSDDQRELLPTRLLRGAQGKVPEEAAIVLLTRAEVLSALYPTSIAFDLDQDLAWTDWRAATAEAGRAPADTRVVLLIAAALAAEGQHLQPGQRRALEQAIEHLALHEEHVQRQGDPTGHRPS